MDAREKREKSILVEKHGTGAKHENLQTDSDSLTGFITHLSLRTHLEERDDCSPGRQVNLHPT